MASEFITKIKYKVDSSDLKEARNELSKTNTEFNKTEGSSAGAGNSLSKVFAIAKTAAIGLAAVGTAAVAAANSVRKEFSNIQQINDLSDFTGAAVDKLADLEARSKLVGFEFENLTAVIIKQQEQIGEGSEIFEKLGISVERLSQLDPAQAFQEIVNAINDVEDTSIRSRAITQLIGESEINALKLGGSLAEVNEQLKQARAGGFIVGEDDVERARRLDQLTNEITAGWAAVRRQLALSFGPALVATFEKIVSAIERISSVSGIELVEREIDSATRAYNDLVEAQSRGEQVSEKQLQLAAERIVILDRERALLNELEEQEARRSEIAEIPGNMGISNINAQIEGRKEISQLSERQAAIEQELLTISDQKTANEIEFLTVSQNITDTRIEQEARTISNNKALERSVELNDQAYENIKKYVEELSRQEEFFARINTEIDLQKTAFEQISSGRIRSQEELNSFLENEREIQRLINESKSIGIELTKQEAEEMVNVRREQENTNRETLRRAEALRDIRENLITGLGQELGDQIAEGLRTGELNFKQFAANVVEILLRSGIDSVVQSLLNPQSSGSQGAGNAIASFFANLFGGGQAKGGAWNDGTQFFAKGGVVNATTAFGMSNNKIGVMGEAGPEAILPLTRTPNGDLGVKSVGGGSGSIVAQTNINVTVNASSDQPEAIGEETAKAIDRLVTNTVKRTLYNETRSGNSLNRGF